MKTGTFLGVATIMGAMVVAGAQADEGERIRESGASRVEAIRGMEGFRASEIRGFRGTRTFAQPRVVTTRRVVAARPIVYRTRSEVIRPSRRIIRSEFARPVAFRRGVVMRERRLSSARFADRDRFMTRRGEFRRADLRERRRFVRRAAFVSGAYAPAYYSSYNYPTDYFTPTTYYTPTYYTPSTYYTTTTTAPRFTTITTVPRYTTVTTAPRYTYALTGTSTLLSVQTRLADLGYYEGPLDGIMGPMTRSAILRYQRDRGLPGFGGISTTLLISLGLA